jgi:hypothetical protein
VKALSDWLSTWQHVVLVLGLLVITLLAAIFVPGPTWDKLGSTVSMVLENPAAAIGAASTLGGIAAAFRWAYQRTPNAPSSPPSSPPS